MIISIEGKMGSGKTLTATVLGFDAYVQKRRILSNFQLNFPFQLFGPEEFYNLNESNLSLNNCMVLADEGYLLMDSRNSMSMLNRMLNYWLVQTRKRHVDLIIATHEFTRLDKRVRAAVDLRIGCRYELRGFQIAYQRDSSGQLVLDPQTGNPKKARNENGDPIFIKKVILPDGTATMAKSTKTQGPRLRLMLRNMQKGTVNIKFINPVPFMKYFDTEEIIKVPQDVMSKGQ